MQAWLAGLYFRYSNYQAGLVKHSLPVNRDGTAAFSYAEKGHKIDGQPTLVFVHGLASNKETWLSILKNIPDDCHCITIDLPGHGETVGLNEEQYSFDKFADSLKLFFDEKHLTDPMCIIGASMGGSIVGLFAVKYPSYVSMIGLLAPAAIERYETELVKEMRTGVFTHLIPETAEQLHTMFQRLTVKKLNLPRPFLNGLIQLRLPLLGEHKKVISALINYEQSYLEEQCQRFSQVDKPVLILWGRQDEVYVVETADYFANIFPKAEKHILENCGHFMAIDQPEAAAQAIITFFKKHIDTKLNQ